MHRKNIPFFNYPDVFVSIENEVMSVIQDVGRRGAFILQKDLHDFEKHLASMLALNML